MTLKKLFHGIVLLIFLSFSVVATAPQLPQQQLQNLATTKQIQFVMKYHIDESEAKKIVSLARRYAQRAGIDTNRFLALISVESGFRQYVVSKSHAVGFVQHIDKWHPEKIQMVREELGYYDRFEMRANLLMGALIAAEYRERYGSRWMQAYNGSLNDKTMKYTRQINAKYKELQT